MRLLEGQRQIVLTCDRYPKEVNGLEERLKSRLGWGLTVSIEPPELETSVAILMSKAANEGVVLPEEVAFFIAKRIRSNVRELEGALRRVIANSTFTGRPISLDFAKEALRDLLALQDRLVSIENIQKTVADYFKMRVADLLVEASHRGLSPDRGKLRWPWPKNLPTTACRKLAMLLAAAITRRCCMVVAESLRYEKQKSELMRIIVEPVENADGMMWISRWITSRWFVYPQVVHRE